jgi:hypothetical protein
LQQDDEVEGLLTQPLETVGGYGHIERSPRSKSDSVRPRTYLSQTYSTYSGDVGAGRSSVFQSPSYYAPSREQERDEMRAHPSVSGSYLGTVRSAGNYDDNIKASPSWLSNSPVTQSYTPTSWRTYSTSGDEAFGQSRYRTTLSGTWHLRINKMNI